MATVNIIQQGEHGKIKLNIPALKDVLLHPDVVEKRIAIFSIAGPYGSGKSFLFNLLLHHERRKRVSTADLPSFDDEHLHNVFLTGEGEGCRTEGIYITKQPYIIKTSGKDMTEVAVFFMDTQGMFDHDEDTGNSALIVGLSMLLSTVQFFNVQNRIDGNHIQFICKFAEFAQTLQEKGNAMSPFQRMFFLVRDWEKPSYDHGIEGGKKYLHEILNRRNSRSNEHATVREYLKNNFADGISCCMLPPPGKAVKIARGGDESCKMKDQVHLIAPGFTPASTGVLNTFVAFTQDIAQDFYQKTSELLDHISSPENILMKTMNGQHIDAKELFDYSVEFGKLIDQGDITYMEGFLEAGHNVKMKEVLFKCLMHYWKGFNSKLHSYWREVDEDTLKKDHAEFKKKAQESFKQMPKPGGMDFQEEWSRKLDEFLVKCLQEIQDDIGARRDYAGVIENFTKSLRKGIQLKLPSKLKEEGEAALKAAVNELKTKIPVRFHRRFLQQLSDDVNTIHDAVVRANKKNIIILGTSLATVIAGALTAASFLIPPLLAAAIAAETSTAALISGWIGGAAVVGGALGGGTSAILAEFEDLHTEGCMAEEETDVLFLRLTCGSTEILLPRE